MSYAHQRGTVPSQLGKSGAPAPQRATASGAGTDILRLSAWLTEPSASAPRRRSAPATYPKHGPITAKSLQSLIVKWVIGCHGRPAQSPVAAANGEEAERLSPSLGMGVWVARVPSTRQKVATGLPVTAKWLIVVGLHGQTGAVALTERPRGTASGASRRCPKKAAGLAAEKMRRRRRGARRTFTGRRIVLGQIGVLSALVPLLAATQR